jgi:hypothetical protein
MGWWRFTRRALEALTAPVDADAADRAVRDLAHDSALGGALHGLSRSVRRSWADSQLRAWVIVLRNTLTSESPAQTMRVRGWIAVVAGAATIVFNAAKPVPVGPMSALVPVLVVVAGAVVMLLAAPLAGAAADRSRHKRS